MPTGAPHAGHDPAYDAHRRIADERLRAREDRQRKTREVTDTLHRLSNGGGSYSDCRMIATLLLEAAGR